MSAFVTASSPMVGYRLQWQWQSQPANTSNGPASTSIHHQFDRQTHQSLEAQEGSSNGDSDYDTDDETPPLRWELVLQHVMQASATAF
ncbi:MULTISPECIES: hypothetical protein [unclassified Acidisoma]|jgi:hypothetical protein|uniref:hypothetical protein n=1 Tax=unclassified Acidisoma TaxID=2634065 RepID=UPI00131D405F|nr:MULTISPECIES: hypothetical protein [unclassified Acidisoma]